MTSNIIPRSCSLDDCNRIHYAKGLCNIHYQRFMATGKTSIREFPTECSVSGCKNIGKITKGLCRKHYHRMRRNEHTDETVIIGYDKRRLLANCEKVDSGCWEWKRYTKLGYGITCLNGEILGAHRASWIIFRGEIPEGMQVNHKCHNRKCINPDHLYVGTQQQNVDDMINAGREVKAHGERSGMTTLKNNDVIKLREMLSSGNHTQKQLSMIFKVCESTIRNIRDKKTWKYL